MKQQKGIALIELMIALTILGSVMTWYSVTKSKQYFAESVNTAISKLSEEITMIQQYEAESAEPTGSVLRFPVSPNELVVSGLVDECTVTEQSSGDCRSVALTPWGEDITYTRIDGEGDDTISTHLRITYPLTVFLEQNEADRVARMFMQQLPFATYDDVAKELSVRVNRSNASVMLAGFLTSDGETPLTDDWDVGGDYSIYNAKGVYVATSAGTQQNLAAGTVASFSTTNGTPVQKPNCADGLSPAINTSIKALSGTSIQATGAAVTRYVEYTNYWIVYLQYRAQNASGTWGTHTTGEIAVDVSCVQ